MVLHQFTKSGVIDKSKLGAFNELAQTAYADELRILNSPRLTLDDQRSLFGAVRNVHVAAKSMRDRLSTASQRHENPVTANQALEVCESLFNLSPYIDGYLKSGKVPERRTINDISRMLYKKAKRYGFSEDAATQFKALNIGSDDIQNFTKKLEEKIQAEVDADDDDVGSVNEGSN
jgi:hypothetical protein